MKRTNSGKALLTITIFAVAFHTTNTSYGSHYDDTEIFKKLNETAPTQFKFNTTVDGMTLVPFITDGCSFYPESISFEPGSIQLCCIQHDFRYWLGGTKEERLQADRELKRCLMAYSISRPMVSLIYRSVRIFGGPNTGHSFQWGYGWRKPDGSLANVGYNRPSLAGLCEIVQSEHERKEKVFPIYRSMPQRAAPTCE